MASKDFFFIKKKIKRYFQQAAHWQLGSVHASPITRIRNSEGSQACSAHIHPRLGGCLCERGWHQRTRWPAGHYPLPLPPRLHSTNVEAMACHVVRHHGWVGATLLIPPIITLDYSPRRKPDRAGGSPIHIRRQEISSAFEASLGSVAAAAGEPGRPQKAASVPFPPTQTDACAAQCSSDGMERKREEEEEEER